MILEQKKIPKKLSSIPNQVNIMYLLIQIIVNIYNNSFKNLKKHIHEKSLYYYIITAT